MNRKNKEYVGECVHCKYTRKFSHASNYFASKKKGFICYKCSRERYKEVLNKIGNFKSNKKEEYNRQCPECNTLIYYSSRRTRNNTHRRNGKCRNCADKDHRLWCINNRKNIYPRYNNEACRIFDDINDKLGWNLGHALNGGEIQIDGYFLDAYDKKQNIVIEYDELHHNLKRIKQKDTIRQNNIIKKLGCKFYRIKHGQNWKDVICQYQ